MSSKHLSPTHKLQKSLDRLEKEINSGSHAIEEAALYVLKCDRVAELEEPDLYPSLQRRKISALSKASKVERARCLRTLRRAKKSRLGTSARLNGLKSFIYDMEHYLIPVLEKVSPETYRAALNLVLSDAVMEYSTCANDFEEYVAKEILQIITRAERLGIQAPQEVRAKCEKALSLSILKFFERFEMLSDTFWDNGLKSRVIGTFGDRSITDPSFYDPLLMTISKIPESRIREKIRRSDPKGNLEVTGQGLLDIARKFGLFGTKENPTSTFFVVKGYLGAFRNKPHHDFMTPPFQRVVDSILFTNQVLKMIDAE